MLKGVGYVDEDKTGTVFAALPRPAWRTPTDPRVKGYAHYDGLELDASIAEELASYRGAHGTLFRGAQTVCIAKVKQMYGNDPASNTPTLLNLSKFARRSHLSRKEADVAGNILPEGFEPAVDLRVMGVHDRCTDLAFNEHEPEPLRRVAQAQKYLADDTGDSSIAKSHRKYLEVVAQRLGESLGVAHVHGTTLMGVNPANTTLAGEPVDYDSVQENQRVNEWAYDGQRDPVPPFDRELRKGIETDLMDIAQYKNGAAWGALPTLFSLADDLQQLGSEKILTPQEIFETFRAAYQNAFEKIPHEVEEILENIQEVLEKTTHGKILAAE